MKPIGKTACFLSLFILVSPLYAAPFPDVGLSFTDELLIFGELFSGEDTADSQPDDAITSGPADTPSDEPLPAGGNPPAHEPLPAEEPPPGDEPLLAEESPSDKEMFLDEEALLNEYALLFEAPPLIFEVPVYETRSLDDIFPNLSRRQKTTVFGSEGLRNSFQVNESPTLIPNPNLGIDLFGAIMRKNPSHLIEALVVVPYNEGEIDLLDIYNALGRIEKIKNYPASMNGSDFYVFTESSRIESSRNRRDISDPSPALILPFSETMYLRLKEINFGNLFIRGDVSISMYGITYSMTNFTDVRYFLVPIMKAERFATIIYLEPVKEGVLIYSMSGFYLPGFIADRTNLTPSINRRIEIFIRWITSGLQVRQ